MCIISRFRSYKNPMKNDKFNGVIISLLLLLTCSSLVFTARQIKSTDSDTFLITVTCSTPCSGSSQISIRQFLPSSLTRLISRLRSLRPRGTGVVPGRGSVAAGSEGWATSWGEASATAASRERERTSAASASAGWAVADYHVHQLHDRIVLLLPAAPARQVLPLRLDCYLPPLE